METIRLGDEYKSINKNDINLHLIRTNKFKTITITLLMRRPIQRDEVTKNALISYILKKGCSKYQNLSELNLAVEELYGSVFDVNVIKKGEEQILQFLIEFVSVNDLFGPCLEFMKEVAFSPLTELKLNHSHPNPECFKEEFFETEKENLRKTIEARINSKGEYVKSRCLEEMYKDEPFGLLSDGYAEDLDGIENGALFEHYKKLLYEAQLEYIVVGDIPDLEGIQWLK